MTSQADFNDFSNLQVAALPTHLKQFIVPQHYEHYSPIDQAVWRYVLRQNCNFLSKIAYYPYLPGLKAAGLTTEKIPDLQEMNDALGKIGWGAVTVDGFIPPAAFMEYQACRVLVIAADIRSLQHIEYTPAPDIIHESTGHAPIIAHPDYNRYLSNFGAVGAKAMYSSRDFDLYEAIRVLSLLKDKPDTTPAELKRAEERLTFCQENMGEPSEMALISRLHWWTVEYGLIGTLDDWKIYGAGLLSSIGESSSCLQEGVKKYPYSLETLHYAYDITQPQPQLFVTPTFQHLVDVLEQFASTMSFRVGGALGLERAIGSGNTCTAVYSSGLQVSGRFSEFLRNDTVAVNSGIEPANSDTVTANSDTVTANSDTVTANSDTVAANHDISQVSYLKTVGPTMLAIGDKQLPGHSKDYHAEGFGSPVGKLKECATALENLSSSELESLGIIASQPAVLDFESGIVVNGRIKKILYHENKLILISFQDCQVKDKKGTVLFEPHWGIYDMAVGERIVSVFCGAADKAAYEDIPPISSVSNHSTKENASLLGLSQLYQEVRNTRQGLANSRSLETIWQELQQNYADDWLCPLEILELLPKASPLYTEIRQFLLEQETQKPALRKLVHNGLILIEQRNS